MADEDTSKLLPSQNMALALSQIEDKDDHKKLGSFDYEHITMRQDLAHSSKDMKQEEEIIKDNDYHKKISSFDYEQIPKRPDLDPFCKAMTQEEGFIKASNKQKGTHYVKTTAEEQLSLAPLSAVQMPALLEEQIPKANADHKKMGSLDYKQKVTHSGTIQPPQLPQENAGPINEVKITAEEQLSSEQLSLEQSLEQFSEEQLSADEHVPLPAEQMPAIMDAVAPYSAKPHSVPNPPAPPFEPHTFASNYTRNSAPPGPSFVDTFASHYTRSPAQASPRHVAEGDLISAGSPPDLTLELVKVIQSLTDRKKAKELHLAQAWEETVLPQITAEKILEAHDYSNNSYGQRAAVGMAKTLLMLYDLQTEHPTQPPISSPDSPYHELATLQTRGLQDAMMAHAYPNAKPLQKESKQILAAVMGPDLSTQDLAEAYSGAASSDRFSYRGDGKGRGRGKGGQGGRANARGGGATASGRRGGGRGRGAPEQE